VKPRTSFGSGIFWAKAAAEPIRNKPHRRRDAEKSLLLNICFENLEEILGQCKQKSAEMKITFAPKSVFSRCRNVFGNRKTLFRGGKTLFLVERTFFDLFSDKPLATEGFGKLN
jgi:hypothetical protein